MPLTVFLRLWDLGGNMRARACERACGCKRSTAASLALCVWASVYCVCNLIYVHLSIVIHEYDVYYAHIWICLLCVYTQIMNIIHI